MLSKKYSLVASCNIRFYQIWDKKSFPILRPSQGLLPTLFSDDKLFCYQITMSCYNLLENCTMYLVHSKLKILNKINLYPTSRQIKFYLTIKPLLVVLILTQNLKINQLLPISGVNNYICQISGTKPSTLWLSPGSKENRKYITTFVIIQKDLSCRNLDRSDPRNSRKGQGDNSSMV